MCHADGGIREPENWAIFAVKLSKLPQGKFFCVCARMKEYAVYVRVRAQLFVRARDH